MYKYTVNIRINGWEWGEYIIVASSSLSATFIAGMKFQREETAYAGDFITVSATPDPLLEEII